MSSTQETSSQLLIREFYTLYVLQQLDRLTLNELATYHLLRNQQTRIILKRLEEKGMVARQLKQWILTANGRQIKFLHELQGKPK